MNATIYTINTCNFCKSAKDFFTSKNIQFTEKNVEQDKAALDEMLKLSDNFAGVPFTVITKDDGTTVSLKGFTLQEFEHATSGGMDMSTPNIPTVPNVPIETVPVEAAPVAEPTPTIVEPMSQMPLNTPAEPVSTPEPVAPVVEPVTETPAMESVPTPEPVAETPQIIEPVSAPMSQPSQNTPMNSSDDVDKKLDTLLQSLQSKTEDSEVKPAEEPTPAPMDLSSSANAPITPNVPMDVIPTVESAPTPDTNINNPLYQAAAPASNAVAMDQNTPATSNVADNIPTVPNVPIDSPISPTPLNTPAMETTPTPSIPDFKPKM